MNFYNYPDVGLKYSPFIDSGATSLGGDGSSFNVNSCTVYQRGVRDSDLHSNSLFNSAETMSTCGNDCCELILIQSPHMNQSFLCGDYLTSYCVYFPNSTGNTCYNFYVYRLMDYAGYGIHWLQPIFCHTFSRGSTVATHVWHQVTGLCAKIAAMDVMAIGSREHTIPVLRRCKYHALTTECHLYYGCHMIQYACSMELLANCTVYYTGTCKDCTSPARLSVWAACQSHSSYWSSAAPATHYMNSYPIIRATTHSKPKTKGSSISYFFGGDQPDKLSEYYNGGSYVSDSSIPSSGAIKFSDFYGSGSGSFDDIDLQCVWKKFCECWVTIYVTGIYQNSARQHFTTTHRANSYNCIIPGSSFTTRDWDGWCADTFNIGTSSGLNTGLNYSTGSAFHPFGPKLDWGYSTGTDVKTMGGIQDGGDDLYDYTRFAGIIWQPCQGVCPIQIGATRNADGYKPTWRQITYGERNDSWSITGYSLNHNSTRYMWNYLSWNPSAIFVDGTEGSGAMGYVHCITYCNETICFVHFIGERSGASYSNPGYYGHSSGDTMYPLSLIIKTSKSNWLSVYSYANWGSDGQGSCSNMVCHAHYYSNNMQGNDGLRNGEESYIIATGGQHSRFTLHCEQCIFTGTQWAYNDGNGDPSATYSLSVYHSPQWTSQLNNSTHGYLKSLANGTSGGVCYMVPVQTGTWNKAEQWRNFAWCGGQMTNSGSADFNSSYYNCNNIFVWNNWHLTDGWSSQTYFPGALGCSLYRSLVRQLCVIAEDNGGFG